MEIERPVLFSTEVDKKVYTKQSMVMPLFKVCGLLQVDLDRKGLRKSVSDGG